MEHIEYIIPSWKLLIVALKHTSKRIHTHDYFSTFQFSECPLPVIKWLYMLINGAIIS